MSNRWYELENVAEIDSPAVVVYPDRIAENLRRMIAIAGSVDRLRPHVKTHKMSAIVRMQGEMGIRNCKCATLAEADMAASAGATDVLLAHQPVGPKIPKLAALARRSRQTRFSTIVDDPQIARAISEACRQAECQIDLSLDLDVGMGRSGIRPGAEAAELYRMIARLPNVSPGGLHAYDGHIQAGELAAREAACEAGMQPAVAFLDQLRSEGLPVPRFVAGGTPTFPFHARHGDRECSPGTCVLNDAQTRWRCADLDFLDAAVVLSRVVSKPGRDRLCLDLGHKAVAADPVQQPRVVWLDLPDATAIMHSEEHLVIETPLADRYQVGDALYGVPWHICPTCALHAQAIVARGSRAIGTWPVDARDRV
jgi:D-serine deaminase-like pyridoxal phosphate-dependent protein